MAILVLIVMGLEGSYNIMLPSFAYEIVDGEYYACPGERISVKTVYDPDVSGNVQYSFSGCDSMTVSGSWPNYVIVIAKEGSYHIHADSNSPFLLDNDYIIHISHIWNDYYTTDRSPTCIEAGTESIHCGRCNATKDSRVIPANGHSWEDTATIDIAPTCTTNGSQSIHCVNCDAIMNEEVITMLGHDLIHHKEKAPYLESGWFEYDTCSRCDYSTFEDPGGYGVWILGQELSYNYCADERGSWTYNAQTSTLTICRNSEMTAVNTDFPCIYSAHDLTIDCAGYDFSIKCPQNTSRMCIYADGNLAIQGGGSIFVQSTNNKEFCVACAPSVLIDGTELSGFITGTSASESIFTGLFADNIKLMNNGVIYLGFGPCEILQGILANNNGTIEIDQGEIRLLHSTDGCFSEHGIECGLLKCVDGNIHISANGLSNDSSCILGNSIQLIKGRLETSTGNNSYSINANNIDITSDFSLSLSGNKRWSVTPVYYPTVLDGIVIQDIPDQEYTGRQIMPKLDISYNDFVLVQGTPGSYSVDFESNIKTGEAMANIIFFDFYGNEVGSLTKSFNIIGCEHTNTILVEKKDASCTSVGNTEYYKCIDCGKAFSDEDRLETIEEKDYLLPAKGHIFGPWKITSYASELTNGQQSRSCKVCGHSQTTSIAALAPTLPNVKISKPKAAKKAATVKWKKISKKNRKLIKNVEIQISTDASFNTGVRTIFASSKKSSKKINGLVKGQKYFVRVRAYSDGHVSVWSVVKSVKAR